MAEKNSSVLNGRLLEKSISSMKITSGPLSRGSATSVMQANHFWSGPALPSSSH